MKTKYKKTGGTVGIGNLDDSKRPNTILHYKGSKEANTLDSLTNVYRDNQAVATERLAKAYPKADIKGIVKRAAEDKNFKNSDLESKVDSIHKVLGFDPNIPGDKAHIKTQNEYTNYTGARKGVVFNQTGTKENDRLEKTGLRAVLTRIPRDQGKAPYKVLDKDYVPKMKCGGKVKHARKMADGGLLEDEDALSKVSKGAGLVTDLMSSMGNENETGGLGNAMATIGNVAGSTASMAAEGAKIGGPAGAIVGGAIGLTKGIVGAIASGKEKRRTIQKKQLVEDKSKVSEMAGAMAKGGKVKGAGTGTSDSIPSKLDGGDFIVPAKNAEKALGYGKEHLGWKDGQTATLQDGDESVKVSNGEVRFTKDEAEYLAEIGVDLKSLAPEAKSNTAYASKGKLPDDEPYDRLSFAQKYMSGGTNDLMKPKSSKIADLPLSKKLAETKKYKPTKYDTKKAKEYNREQKQSDPDKQSTKAGKALKWAGKNPGMVLGVAQLGAGLVQSIKNSKEEKGIKAIKSPSAAFGNEAQKLKSAADQAAAAIMHGTKEQNASATSNYMRIAKESGGSNSGAVLANAAKVSNGNTESYLKGMTTAAQLKVGAQEGASKLVTEGAKAATDTESINRQFAEQRLARKAENANALIKGGGENIAGQAIMNSVQKRLAKNEEDYGTMADQQETIDKKNGVTKTLATVKDKPVTTYEQDLEESWANKGKKKGGYVPKIKNKKSLRHGR